MDRKIVLRWAEAHHYPQLVVAPHTIIRARQADWQEFLEACTDDEYQQMVERIKKWKELEERAG